MTWIKTVTKARAVSVPLVALITPDVGAATRAVLDQVGNGDVSKVAWNCQQGLLPLNEKAQAELPEALRAAGLADARMTKEPVAMLLAAQHLAPGSLLCAQNLHLFWQVPAVQQGVANLREAYKQNHRMMLALGCDATLPPVLRHDVLVLEEKLPDDAALETIARELCAAADLAVREDQVPNVVAATRGLAAFDAEQVMALALRSSGYDMDALWLHKRQAVNATPGLTLEWGGPTFEQIGGLHHIKSLLSQLQDGPVPASCYVFIDEVEKGMAGAAGGNDSGTSAYIHQALLTAMERMRARGLLFLGHPGTGKTLVAAAAGATFGKPTVSLDLGSLKSGTVGSTEANTRAALQVIEAIAGTGAVFIATCNRLESLSPELRRRFSMGTYFFDLPDPEERAAVWSLHLQRRNLTANLDQCVARSEGWSSANIRDCCDRAYELSCAMAEAEKRIVPATSQDPDGVQRLRDSANGRFLSASYGGVYMATAAKAPQRAAGRRVSVQ
jgi:hypothetical protein